MIIFFTKAPRLGFGKSRLRRYLSDEDILKLNKKLIKTTYKSIRCYEHRIYYSGNKKNLDFLELKDGIKLLKQKGSNLGERMKEAMFDSLKSNEKVILIGSDLVGMNSNIIENAYQSLDEVDLVVAKSYDGGYGLIGMKKHLDVFTDITYQTDHVLDDLIALAKNMGISYKIVGQILDIDTFDDLVRAETKSYDIKLIGQGEYNINYLVDGKVFRVNLGSQMDLKDEQIAYEYQALKELEKSDVTPKVYKYKKRGDYLPYGFLYEKYLFGRELDYNKDLKIAGRLLSTIHNIEAKNSKLIKANKPFLNMYEEFEKMFGIYKTYEKKDPLVEDLVDKMMEIARSLGLDEQIKRESIINTELNNRNFIIGEKSYVIDWEKPLIGDCEQDLAHFLVPTTTNWKTSKILADSEIEEFLLEYEKYRQIDRNLLRKYMVFNTLRGITWSLMARVEYEKAPFIKNEETYNKILSFTIMEFITSIYEKFFKG